MDSRVAIRKQLDTAIATAKALEAVERAVKQQGREIKCLERELKRLTEAVEGWRGSNTRKR